jgi:hypothetical protein
MAGYVARQGARGERFYRLPDKMAESMVAILFD